jgi:hypothetical protein
VNQVVTYATSESSILRQLFIDFTTMAPETNDAPEWSSNAPEDGTVIPVLGLISDNDLLAVAGERTEMWATDDSGWGLECSFAETGWSASLDGEGDLMVSTVNTQAQSSDAECYVVDPFGSMSIDSRNWIFGEVFTSSGLLSETGDSIEFTITPTGLVNELEISAHAHQMNTMGQMRSVTLASDASTISLPLDGLSPGAIMVMGQAESSTMLALDFMLDFDLEKASLPPLVTVKKNLDGENATWEASGLTFTLQGDDWSTMDWDAGNSQVMPTEAEIATKAEELRVADSYSKPRRNEYPLIGDQLDDLYIAGAFSSEMNALIAAVKTKYPKP